MASEQQVTSAQTNLLSSGEVKQSNQLVPPLHPQPNLNSFKPDPMDFSESNEDEEEFKSSEKQHQPKKANPVVNPKVGLGLTDLVARPNTAAPVRNQQREQLAKTAQQKRTDADLAA